MLHDMKLNPEPFSLIKSGRKRYELRLYDEKRRALTLGDEIRFTNTATGKMLTVTVIGLHVYKSFTELYDALPHSEIGYTDDDISTASPLDMEKYYSPVEIEKYGVVAIEIKPQ